MVRWRFDLLWYGEDIVGRWIDTNDMLNEPSRYICIFLSPLEGGRDLSEARLCSSYMFNNGNVGRVDFATSGSFSEGNDEQRVWKSFS